MYIIGKRNFRLNVYSILAGSFLVVEISFSEEKTLKQKEIYFMGCHIIVSVLEYPSVTNKCL